MVAHAWQGIIMVIMALSLLAGCASSPYVGTGALVGGGLGSVAGAAIGNRNPWAGALIGGLVGTGLGAAGGYMVQQRQAQPQPQQGYYSPPPSGYSAPPPPGYGYRTPPPGPSYGGGYNTPNPVVPPGPQYSAAPAPPEYYSQNQAPQPSSVRTPITNAPYNYESPLAQQ